ncbi:hypothetical protein GCM10029964_090570 [Kibdelosporangium lantanae]
MHVRTTEQLDSRSLANQLATTGQPLDSLLFDRVVVDLGKLDVKSWRLVIKGLLTQSRTTSRPSPTPYRAGGSTLGANESIRMR